MRTLIAVVTLGLAAACNQTKDTAAEKASAAKAEVAKAAVVEAKAQAKAATDQAQAPKKAKEAWENIPELSIAETEAAIKAGATVIDANGAETRGKFGVIPGALKLASYKEYDPKSVLPKDKSAQLVFYCSNTKCTAAPKAAVKALEAGYTNVSHLKVGIKGWVDAGKNVNKG